jgi:UDP-N-acetylmuramate dehydrogenase
VSDEGIFGCVVHIALLGITTEVREGRVYLTAAAGESLDDVVAYTATEAWWGIENLSHIPGSVGATPVQNVGAYGVEVKDIIETVEVFNTETEVFEVLSCEACAFAYRDSLFKHESGKKYIITGVTFRLSTEANPKISYKDLARYFGEVSTPSIGDIRNAVIKIRADKFPDWHTIGTAGSFFKNPHITQEACVELQKQYPGLPAFSGEQGMMKISLAYVLDTILGRKGYCENGVCLFEKQPLVLTATKTTASEIKIFAEKIIDEVKNKIGVDVEMEVTEFSAKKI